MQNLKEWLRKRRVSVVKLARDINRSEGYLRHILSGARTCSAQIAQQLSEYTEGELAVEEIITKDPLIQCPTCCKWCSVSRMERLQRESKEKEEVEKVPIG